MIVTVLQEKVDNVLAASGDTDAITVKELKQILSDYKTEELARAEVAKAWLESIGGVLSTNSK